MLDHDDELRWRTRLLSEGLEHDVGPTCQTKLLNDDVQVCCIVVCVVEGSFVAVVCRQKMAEVTHLGASILCPLPSTRCVSRLLISLCS